MNLTATIRHFAVAHTVRRAIGAQTIGSDGFAVAPTMVDLSIKLVVTPATGRDILQLPEGQRTEATIVAFAADELRGSSVTTGYPGDVIERGGEDWLILNVETWEQGTYYRALAQRVGR